MFEPFGWNVGMSLLASTGLVLGAVVIGAIAQFLGEATFGYEWVFTAIGAVVGGWLGSEAFGTLSTWGLVFDGLYILPALIGGVIVGGVTSGVIRYFTGTYVSAQPRPI